MKNEYFILILNYLYKSLKKAIFPVTFFKLLFKLSEKKYLLLFFFLLFGFILIGKKSFFSSIVSKISKISFMEISLFSFFSLSCSLLFNLFCNLF